MKTTTKIASALKARRTQDRETTPKIERALEIRKSSSKAREGKPLSFPTRRMYP